MTVSVQLQTQPLRAGLTVTKIARPSNLPPPPPPAAGVVISSGDGKTKLCLSAAASGVVTTRGSNVEEVVSLVPCSASMKEQTWIRRPVYGG